jgi:SAM-dependent methyltransferase
MSTLLDAERDTYSTLWGAQPAYAEMSPGERYLPIFQSLVGPMRPRRVLDAGTGSGKGALALAAAGFEVTCCDVTDDGLVEAARRFPFYPLCLWHDLTSTLPGRGWARTVAFDYVYCTDVLEHLPTQFTMLAVQRLLAVTKIGLFLTVGLEPDHFGAWIGKPLHQTVQPFVWWRDSLGELATILNARDLHHTAAFYLEPR